MLLPEINHAKRIQVGFGQAKGKADGFRIDTTAIELACIEDQKERCAIAEMHLNERARGESVERYARFSKTATYEMRIRKMTFAERGFSEVAFLEYCFFDIDLMPERALERAILEPRSHNQTSSKIVRREAALFELAIDELGAREITTVERHILEPAILDGGPNEE